MCHNEYHKNNFLIQNSSRGNLLSQLFHLGVPSIRQKLPEVTFVIHNNITHQCTLVFFFPKRAFDQVPTELPTAQLLIIG